MQYDYALKTNLNGNIFIEFQLENNTHGYNYYGKDFINGLLSALNEIKPSLKSEDNYRAFLINNNDESADEKIKENFEAAFNPDCNDEFDKLVIETVCGRILLEEGKNSRIILTGENDSDLINKVDNLLKSNYLFNKNKL